MNALRWRAVTALLALLCLPPRASATVVLVSETRGLTLYGNYNGSPINQSAAPSVPFEDFSAKLTATGLSNSQTSSITSDFIAAKGDYIAITTPGVPQTLSLTATFAVTFGITTPTHYDLWVNRWQMADRNAFTLTGPGLDIFLNGIVGPTNPQLHEYSGILAPGTYTAAFDVSASVFWSGATDASAGAYEMRLSLASVGDGGNSWLILGPTVAALCWIHRRKNRSLPTE